MTIASIPKEVWMPYPHAMISKVNSLISELQVAQFRTHGYCVVDGLYSPEEINEIESFFEEFKIKGGNVFNDVTQGNVSYQDIDPSKAQLRSVMPHRYSPRIKEWFLHPNIAEVLEVLLERPALGVQTMYYFKPPGGKGQGMHQDNIYLLSKPATCIAAWTAIDTADTDNGCLWVVPGSNDYDILCPEGEKTFWMNYGDSHITKFPRDRKPEPVVVPRGSTMFFGGNLIHGSGPNRTKDRFRRTFIGHYIDEASEQVAQFYHPVLNMQGEVVSRVATAAGGGPCGTNFAEPA
jgi:ectoine hydroxylase-related dioxygenase (phytanoyl-CoA dioxygenase family)